MVRHETRNVTVPLYGFDRLGYLVCVDCSPVGSIRKGMPNCGETATKCEVCGGEFIRPCVVRAEIEYMPCKIF